MALRAPDVLPCLMKFIFVVKFRNSREIHPVKEYDYFEWLGAKMARLRSFWNDPRLDYWFNLLKGKSIF
jgi:hypothetical protein